MAQKKTKEELTKNKILSAVNQIFQKAVTCENEEELVKKCLSVAQELSQSKFGFIGEINPQGRLDTIGLSDPGWEECTIDKGSATKMIKDMELRGIWSRVLLNGVSLIANDPAKHPDSVGVPKNHPPLKRFLGVPLKAGERTTGMISLANKPKDYTEEDREAIEAITLPIMEALTRNRAEQALARQAQEIMELSTPVIQIWEGIIIAPLIGTLDSERTQGFLERFLSKIVNTKSSVALLDITGVPTVDTRTAQHLIEAITSAKLLGTKVILTGVRPSIAQTLVHLGIDLEGIETQASLSNGFKKAMEFFGLEINFKSRQISTPAKPA